MEKKVFSATLALPHKEAEIINGFLNAEAKSDFQGKDNIITHSVHFPDGAIMDMHCIGCDNDPSWCQSILYKRLLGNATLSDVDSTDVEDEFLGTNQLEADGVTYIVTVVDGGDIEKPELRSSSAPAGTSGTWRLTGESLHNVE